MALPIVFVHKGNSDYLKYSINQARFFNQSSTIYLIGDDTNNRYSGTEHFLIAQYENNAIEFEKIYKHLNFLPENGVLFWFKRWFIIEEFLRKNNISYPFIYIDSDVLLFSDITKEFENFKSYSMTICGERGPQYTYFSSVSSLSEFCKFIRSLFLDKEYFEKLIEKFEFHKKTGSPGGVDDMTAFYEFKKINPEKVGNTNMIYNNSIYDNNINSQEGYYYDSDNNIKKIYWIGGLPFGKVSITGQLIQFNGLHFQGTAKKFMHRFYVGENLYFQKIKSELYYNVYIPIRIKILKFYCCFLKTKKSSDENSSTLT